MISLNIFSEYIKDSVVGSIKENISAVADANKAKVLKHLTSATAIASIAGTAKDVFTGETIGGEWVLLSDGKYEWTSDIVYYYENYDLILPDDFIGHVLGKQK